MVVMMIKRLLWVGVVCAVLGGVLPARGASRPAPSADLSPAAFQTAASDTLRQALGADTRVSFHSATGMVRFIGSSPAPEGASGAHAPQALDADALGPDELEAAARSFLAAYGPLFGLERPEEDLLTMRREVLDDLRGVIRFQQQHAGLPVFGGEMVLHWRGARLLAAVADLATDVAVDVVPAVGAEDARRRAVEMVAKYAGLPPEGVEATEPALWLYDPRLVGAPGPQDIRLVWRMSVRGVASLHVNELVLVDAHTGAIALHFTQAPTSLSRIIYDNANDPAIGLPGGAPVRTEDMNLAPPVDDVSLAFQYAEDTYRFFESLGRDSIDGKGMPLISTVRYCPPGAQCPYPNAFWNGLQMAYGEGIVIDDVVAHEMTHGVTEYESRLFYYMQSGAINEGFSDAFGEFVDLTNGRGLDRPEDRWLIGEELPNGVGLPVPLRDMQTPPARSHPDRMTSPYYRCTTDDFGGVHTNGGVLSKAVYLMTDGTGAGAFNGQTVVGIGIPKASRILYEAQARLLTSASDYADLSDGLVQAATNLIGQHGITASDVEQVHKAVLATEMHLQPASCAAVEAPVCTAGTPEVLYRDDMEGLLPDTWIGGVEYGADSRWYYPQTTNPYSGWDMTYATSGQFNLWGDADFGGFWYGYGASYGASDSHIAMGRSVPVPERAYLRFAHAYAFEHSVGYAYDGGLVEYSIDEGATWQDAGPLITHNGYTGRLYNGTGNPLAGRPVFSGESHGYTSTRLDLATLAGESLRLRFRIATDDSGGSYGWFIDDVELYTCTAATPTKPATPTATPPTPTPTSPATTPTPGETLPPGPMTVALPLVTHGHSFGAVRNILVDGFEGTFPGPWQVIDNLPNDGREYLWAKSTCRPGEGAHSAWAVGGGAQGSALACGAEYAHDAHAWLVYGPFSLVGAASARLDLLLWLNTVQGQDPLSLMASVDGTQFYGTSISGISGGWVQHGLDLGAVHTLGDLTGQPRVWVAVVFESDGAGAATEGAYIDGVRLWASRMPVSPALSPLAPGAPLPEGLAIAPAEATLHTP